MIKKLCMPGILCLLLSGSETQAQQAEADISPGDSPVTHTITAGSISTAPKLNAKLKSSFNRLFPNAVNPQWTSNESGIYFVSFRHNGNIARASFTRNGMMKYMIATCNNAQLPETLRVAIKEQYDGYQFMKAQEVHAFDEVSWQIVLENESGYITIQFANGLLAEMQQLKKAK